MKIAFWCPNNCPVVRRDLPWLRPASESFPGHVRYGSKRPVIAMGKLDRALITSRLEQSSIFPERFSCQYRGNGLTRVSVTTR